MTEVIVLSDDDFVTRDVSKTQNQITTSDNRQTKKKKLIKSTQSKIIVCNGDTQRDITDFFEASHDKGKTKTATDCAVSTDQDRNGCGKDGRIQSGAHRSEKSVPGRSKRVKREENEKGSSQREKGEFSRPKRSPGETKTAETAKGSLEPHILESEKLPSECHTSSSQKRSLRRDTSSPVELPAGNGSPSEKPTSDEDASPSLEYPCKRDTSPPVKRSSKRDNPLPRERSSKRNATTVKRPRQEVSSSVKRMKPESVSTNGDATAPGCESAAIGSCEEKLDELCALLEPLLAAGESRILTKLRRRHAAVLALSSPSSGRRQHLLGVTVQCADRVRTEPRHCFTMLRAFLEQLDQIKLVASSARSAIAPTSVEKKPPPVSAQDGGGAQSHASAAADDGKSAALPKSVDEETEKRRHRRHLAKLEKTLRRLEREIGRQEVQEVDWEDAAGSTYIISSRLKRRYVKVYRYYCGLVGMGEEAERLETRRIHFTGTRYPGINHRIEKFVNRTREFPDFKDVYGLIETANRRDRLRLSPGAMHDQAKEAFRLLGAQLQRRRRAALAESMDALCGADDWRRRDPADADSSLTSLLADNAQVGRAKMSRVFGEFVQRQESAAVERRRRRKGADDSSHDENEDEESDEDESEVTDEEADSPVGVEDRETPDCDLSEDEEAGGDGTNTAEVAPVPVDTDEDMVGPSDCEDGETSGV